MIRLTHAQLLIADISGYTDFIVNRTVALEHAEQIVSELLDAIASSSRHPLVLNKFEGDAALLFAESGDDPAAAAHAVVAQLAAMFAAFAQRRQQVADARHGCNCDACTNVLGLRLKAFLHSGQIAIKQLHGFVELAGEHVILLHRLLKNPVGEREYVLATADFCVHWPPAHAVGRDERVACEGVGEVDVRVLQPAVLAGNAVA
ncbi:MAG: DUF2652 domain-containing protein [Proteobacteria bacterium]|nr:DUF2652 domain-containing protein [Pseudomonadota bacterium]